MATRDQKTYVRVIDRLERLALRDADGRIVGASGLASFAAPQTGRQG